MKQLDDFITILSKSVENHSFIKITLSKTVGSADLKNVYGRVIALKNTPHLSLTFRYAKRDEVKNWSLAEGISIIAQLLKDSFFNADLFTRNEEVIFQLNKKRDNAIFKTKKISNQTSPTTTLDLSHDKTKKRLLNPNQPYFHALEITDKTGAVTPNGQKKFKQINKFIEIIEHLLQEKTLPNDAVIADMGSGKGYLTLALYDYLTHRLNMTPSVTGFELRENLVNFCNQVAAESGFTGLSFRAQDINQFESARLDMLIALHACDTATDVAIAKGIRAGAEVIIVAPCCHKQIRRALHAQNEMTPLLKYGILKERQAELLTDGIRALLMEAKGYKTKVFEFVGTEHTPKNVMITGVKSKPCPKALEQVAALKQYFGIGTHFLETLI